MTSSDIASARDIGCVVKLLAICQLSPPDGDRERTVSVRVHPAMIPRSHPLAGVGGAYNAVFVESRSAGRLMFYGPGAGGSPTASAVLGDLVTVARNRVRGAVGPGESSYAARPVADDRQRADPLSPLARPSPTSPGCSPGSPRCSPSTTSRIQTVRQNERGDRCAAGHRHPPGARLGPERHRGGAPRARRRTRGDQRDAGGGRVT